MAAQKTKITKKAVDGAAPAETRYAIHDTEITGFRLYVHPTGRKAFHYRYRVGGGRSATIREPKIGDFGSLTVDQARDIARDWAATVRMGGDPSALRQRARSAPRMSDLFKRYLDEHARPHKKEASVRQDIRMIETHLHPALGKTKIEEVTRDQVSSVHRRLSSTPYEANRVLALLSKAFNLAEVWGWRPDGTNPCRHIRKYKEQKRKRFLSPKEISRLGEVLRKAEQDGYIEIPSEDRRGAKRVTILPQAVAAIRLILLTGARKSSEVLGLRWEWVDFEGGRINLPDSKTGDKSIPLAPPALKVLAEIPRLEGTPYVIPGRRPGTQLVNMDHAWRAIRKVAAIEDVRIHDLRHTFAAFGAGSGMSLPVIGALLGHSQPSTTQRYAHLADDPLKEAAGRIGTQLADLLDGQSDERRVISLDARK